MKIAIDCQILNNAQYTGVEVYTFNILIHLLKQGPLNNYVLYFDKQPNQKLLTQLEFTKANYTIKVLKPVLSWRQVTVALDLLFNNVDVFFSSVHTLPLLAVFRTKTVVMIHGVEYEKLRGGLVFNLLKGKHEWFVSTFANHVITPSEHTKSKLKEAFNTNPGKVTVIKEGVNIVSITGREEVAQSRLKYKLFNDYLIFVSTVEPRKNIPFLVQAFSHFVKTDPKFSKLELVICGKRGWDSEESYEAPSKFGVEDKVNFLGFVENEDLNPLLAGAQAFVSASSDEGFGLHLVEAIALGQKCLVSDILAYKEIGEGAVEFFKLNDVYDFTLKLTQTLEKPLSEAQTQKYKEIAGTYTWEASAKDTLSVLNEVANSQLK